ncbi:hypothetical protein DSO57_1037470 [Entomophthora muscae]|uniref:Uncharacterized protein n=1 Tax=Entomophthora muscae TaxID=34485 RepID=A0ACC2SBZ9_9FUNG|nr:hypothetical protein DSO57_1037470 [Entomophthora muscae]
MSSQDTTLMSLEDLIDFKYIETYHGFNLASEMDPCFRQADPRQLTSNPYYGMLSPASPSASTAPMHNPLIPSVQPSYYEQEPIQYSFALMGNTPSQVYPYLVNFPKEYAKPEPYQVPVKEEQAPSSRRMPSLKPKTIPCPYPGCTRVFSRQYNMRAHLEIHAPVRTKDHACPDCGRPFSRRHDMYRHQRNIHHTSKQKPSSPQPGLYHTYLQP